MFYEQYEIKNVLEGDKGYTRVQLVIPDADDVIIDVKTWEYDEVVSEKPSDASEVRNKRAVYVVDKMYEVLKELDIRTGDIGFIMQKLLAKLGGIEEKAINDAFGVSIKQDIRLKRHWDKN
jgi:hypothetical protein